MPSLKSLREEIRRVEALHEVMGTLEKIAANERALARTFFEEINRYENELKRFFTGMLSVRLVELKRQPVRSAQKLLLCFGPDYGLTGALTSRLTRYILDEIAKSHPKKVLVVGKKLNKALEEAGASQPQGTRVVFEYIVASPRSEQASRLFETLAWMVLGGLDRKEFSQVYVISAEYKNFSEYEFYTRELSRVEPVLPPVGREAQDYVFIEESLPAVLARFRGLLFAASVARPWREMKFVEASLRLLETSRAKENAKDAMEKLKRVFARTQRGKITRSINELFTGKQAFDRRKRKAEVYFEWRV